MEGNDGLLAIFAVLSVASLLGVVYPFKPFGKRWIALLSFLTFFFLVGVFASPPEPSRLTVDGGANTDENDRHWVTSDRLNRRTCPSTDCGIVGQLFFREGTQVLEKRDGWARITKAYDASCVNGRSEYVESGNSACDAVNGIVDGRFAEWVSAEYLSQRRPADPSSGASEAEELVVGSDDFEKYRVEFTKAARSLVNSNRCTEDDFREMGGWVKSTKHNAQPVYFMYCGGVTIENRLYLNAKTGEVFR